jgi:hypothetical protein
MRPAWSQLRCCSACILPGRNFVAARRAGNGNKRNGFISKRQSKDKRIKKRIKYLRKSLPEKKKLSLMWRLC